MYFLFDNTPEAIICSGDGRCEGWHGSCVLFLPPSGVWSTMSDWRERECGGKVLRWQSINLLQYERWVILVSSQKLPKRSIHISVWDVGCSCGAIWSWQHTCHSTGRGEDGQPHLFLCLLWVRMCSESSQCYQKLHELSLNKYWCICWYRIF